MLAPRRLRTVRLFIFLNLVVAAAARGEPTAFPQAARDRFTRGQELQKKGRYEEAIGAYEEAIRLGMDAFPRVHLYRANSFLDLKAYDKAIEQYTNFINKFSLEDSCRY